MILKINVFYTKLFLNYNVYITLYKGLTNVIDCI